MDKDTDMTHQPQTRDKYMRDKKKNRTRGCISRNLINKYFYAIGIGSKVLTPAHASSKKETP